MIYFQQTRIGGLGYATSCVVAAINVCPVEDMEGNRDCGKYELSAKTKWIRTVMSKDTKIKGGRYSQLSVFL